MKKTIYLLHGWAYSTSKWQPFIKALKSHGYNPQLLKTPGLTAPLKQTWTLKDYVEWLEKKLPQNSLVLGHSNGGRLALALASTYPQKISKLILIAPAGIYHNNFSIRLKRAIFKSIAKIGQKITKSSNLRNLLYKSALETDYHNAPSHLRQTMANLISQDLTTILASIIVPTLIIWGKKDQTLPLSDGQKIHQLIKNSQLNIIDNARHSPQFTHPQLVTQQIATFLK